MSTFRFNFRPSPKILIFACLYLSAFNSRAQNAPVPEVEWYPPEIENGPSPDTAKVIISGRTDAGNTIRVDSNSIANMTEKPASKSGSDTVERQLLINCKGHEQPDIRSKVVELFPRGTRVTVSEYSDSWVKVYFPRGTGYISSPCVAPFKGAASYTASSNRGPHVEIQQTVANSEGFFEMALELSRGLNQIPVLVTSQAKAQKTFLLSVDVNPKKEEIKMNTVVSKKKPPAAGKKIRIWGGLGLTYQTYDQSAAGAPELAFKTFQAPGILGRGGYWGDRFGFDFYFRDAPGKLVASAPFQVETDTYHWRTMELKGLYQFDRGPSSRMFGLPSQWQLRFGTQLQQIPFMTISNTEVIGIEDHSITMATLGVGLLLGQERSWSYEFAFGLQTPIASSAQEQSFKIAGTTAYEAQVGAAYKIAPDWRLGVFSYMQSLNYNYSYVDGSGASSSGKQGLFYTTFDLRLGYEY